MKEFDDNPRLQSNGKKRWPQKTKKQKLARGIELYLEEQKKANETREVPIFPSAQDLETNKWDPLTDHGDRSDEIMRGGS